MNDASKEEAQLLTAAENELVALTRPPEIERQSVDQLKSLARRLREAHDRAKAIGTRQAREMRGKAGPTAQGWRRTIWEPSPRRKLCARRAGPGRGGTGPSRRSALSFRRTVFDFLLTCR